MKKLICLITLMAVTIFSAYSQTSIYHPFPTGNANWVYEYYDDFHIPTGQFITYSFNGDTVIASINYKKVYKQFNYAGALREDNKIIYFIPDTSLTEVLLYNFNLNVGDTLIHPYGGAVCAYDTAVVWLVDSVLASDGYHRQLWFNSSAIWIEGFGAINYLLNPCNVLCVSGNDVMVCASTDSGVNYPAGMSSCVVSTPENQDLSDIISIFPNPFHQYTNIHPGDQFKNSNMFIYSSTGVLVRTDRMSNTNSYELNRDELTQGIFFILFINADGITDVRKIIIY